MNRFNALADTSSPRAHPSKKKSKKDGGNMSGGFNSFRQAKPTENTRFPKPSSSDSISSMTSRTSISSPTNEKRFNNSRFQAFNNDRRNDRNNRNNRNERRNYGNMSSPRDREANRNSFNWKRKEAEQKENKRMRQIERSEENFPTLSSTSTSISRKSANEVASNNINNEKIETSEKPSYKGLFTFKKSKTSKKKKGLPDPGWVKLKMVNGKVQKTYGKPIVRKQRRANPEVAMEKMFDGIWQTMTDSWNDGFWDCRQQQLEEMLENTLYANDESLSDDEYYSDQYQEEDEETNVHLGRTKRS